MKLTKSTSTAIFPPKPLWDISAVKASGLYTWFKEISEELPNGWVIADGHKMLMLGGFSYLGLNNNKAINKAALDTIEKFGTGMSGSRFLAGTTSLHSRLEKKIAELHNKGDAIFYTSGYLANVSTITALVKRNDYVICDKHSHASITDGARYSAAECVRYRQNDVQQLENILKKIPDSSRKLVVTDSIYSMSGEVANLPEIIKVCKKYGAILMVDECHSMYVLGETGGGIVEYFGINADDIDIIMATTSKAIPASGGYIAANAKIIEFLRHESRGFIYSVSLPSVMAATALKALQIFSQNRRELVKKLHNNTAVFSDALRSYDIPIGKSLTSIVPIQIGDSTVASIAGMKCQQSGLYIHAVYAPVVPAGKAILRASVTAAHTESDLVMAAKKIHKVLKNL